MGRQVQGPVRSGLGQASRRDVRAATEARGHPQGQCANGEASRDSRVGRRRSKDEARARPADGGLRRLHGAYGSSCRSGARRAERRRPYEETLVYVIVGDNGASAEGSLQGTFTEMVTLAGFGALETAESLLPRIDQFGSPTAYNHYAVGWAHAMNTPYQWTKQVASHFGGTRNGTIVHW